MTGAGGTGMSKSETASEPRPSTSELSLDEIHDLLSARRRRYTLYYLYLFENPVYLPDVAEHVTRWEQHESHLLEERLQTYNTLYHTHVPKLANAGIVDYCQQEDMSELAENATRLRPYLEWAAETELDAIDTEGL